MRDSLLGKPSRCSGTGMTRLTRQFMVLEAALLLLAVSAFPVSGQKCRDRCGYQEIRFPFGIDDGCGADPELLLQCVSDTLLLDTREYGNLTVWIDYNNTALIINTTVFISNLCTEFELPPSAYDNPRYETVICHPVAELLPDAFRIGGCQFNQSDEVDIRVSGLTCFFYKKSTRYDSVPVWMPQLAYGSMPYIVPPEKEKQCDSCRGRRGSCGYNTSESSSPFVCYCGYNAVDLSSSSVCHAEKRSRRRPAIIGGVAAGSVLLLLSCLGGFCIFKRRQVERRRYILGDRSPKPSSNSQSMSQGSNSNYSEHGSSTHFTLKVLQEATNNFSEAGRLGDGGFGTVYKGQLPDGRFVAVKKLNPWNAQGKYQFDNEVTILSQVTHPHLVRLYGCCLEGRELLLVYEYVAMGTLADHVHDCRGGFMEWDQRLTIVIQTAEALAFLHTNVMPPIFHRDVKSTNILIDDCFNAKVGDFGLSRLVPSLELTHITTAPQGTPGYLDPDYHQSYQLTDKSDVYSLGVVLMEIVSSQRAVDMSRDRKEINLAAMAVSKIACGQLDKLVDPRLGTESDGIRSRMVEAVAELAFECLAAEKDDRPSMREVAARLKEVAEEGKVKYADELRRGMKSSIGSVKLEQSVGDSPTSVQLLWASHSTSPNDSASSM